MCCLPDITQKGVGESVMVCNRSEWLQNREFSGTVLPMNTMRAAKPIKGQLTFSINYTYVSYGLILSVSLACEVHMYIFYKDLAKQNSGMNLIKTLYNIYIVLYYIATYIEC